MRKNAGEKKEAIDDVPVELTMDLLELRSMTCLVGRKCPAMRTLLDNGLRVQYSKYSHHPFKKSEEYGAQERGLMDSSPINQSGQDLRLCN